MRIGVLGTGVVGQAIAGRAAEMVLPIWPRLMGALQTPMFNFKVAR